MAAADASKLPDGVILPPPEIKLIVEKTASHIGGKGSDGTALEAKIRLRSATDPRFSFLKPDDAYYAYYQHRLRLVRSGEAIADTSGPLDSAALAKPAEVPDDGRPKVPEPSAYEFLADMPPINTVDLDILRLTALFAARSGPRFAQELAQRESQNYQFDFLKPDHSLFRYYNQVVAQYTAVMQADQSRTDRLAARGGGSDYLTESERRAKGRREVLREVRERAMWEKWEREKKQQAANEAERDRVAFAEIDWQDFVVVATVEFTEQDDLIDLPAPISLNDIVNRSLKQKRMAAMIMEGQEVVEEDEDAAQMEIAAAAAVTASKPGALPGGDETAMDVDSDEDAVAAEVQESRLAAPTGAIKIRKDYVPKSKRDKKVVTTTCTICGQQIPEDEMAEHVRIELLDPKWKEKQRQTEANRSAANILPQGADVAASLRNLAKRRTDIFGSHATDEEKRVAEAEEARLRRERESKAWDGHIATAEGITERYQTGANLEEQIAALHRAKGLVESEAAAAAGIGPNVPSGLHQGMSAAAPAIDTAAYAPGAAISAAPNPGLMQPSAYTPAPFGYPGMPAPPPGTFPTGANGIAPRPADAMPDMEPAAKRARLARRPDGSLYPESDWIAAHPDPIMIVVRLPVYTDKPEWNLKGQEIALQQLDLKTLVGSLRDLITREVGVPTGRQQLLMEGRPLNLKNSIASYNVADGDAITLQIRDNKKR